MSAALIDAVLAPSAGFGIVWGLLGHTPSDLMFLLLFPPAVLAISFVNHVAGTVAVGGSAGKQLLSLRVIQAKDAGRPGFWRTVGRWLLGFFLLGLMVLAEDAGGIGEAHGLRVVRRRDLAVTHG
ncbi:RDD family protein [Nocardia sp. NPDC051832]|uniref:RDD family protein n=1 Tax=Nocardia sp. NPDC051832 TaxID=3155673 RepID=UPI00343953C7